ncbi:hypothetical protein [Motilibacter aurantiacus]|uniref:hypothetical protein n=1 Tax=Motilibacter aurantiacus TaxID=2714955 RepID=UPI00140B172F|nr:hypothetical protein [Motilibacter aurantiacus]NHC45299.1 hypothetical protein [Motilibacter aurantiacus]
MVTAYDRRSPRPVCAACNSPVDEGNCPTCRRWRPEPPSGPSSALLLGIAAVLLVVWVALLALA